MKLKSLKIDNFRNYEALDLEVDEKKSIIFCGQNAQGKTNILEAIYLFSIAKSFRLQKPINMIRGGSDYFSVKATFQVDNILKRAEVFVSRQPKTVKVVRINDLNIKITDFLGKFPAVLFSPEDMDLLTKGPSVRRMFLDILLSQLDRAYLLNLINYKSIINRRNHLLKNISQGTSSSDELKFYDQKLVEYGAQVIRRRSRLVGVLNERLKENYKSISAQEDEININYYSLKKLRNQSDEDVEAELAQLLISKRREDIIYKSTNYGPHRDDILIQINGEKVTDFASRGEMRSIILALKIAELYILEDKLKIKPILLLDDVFSELDQSRQVKMLSIIKKYQAFISCNQVPSMDSEDLDDFLVCEVVNGSLKEKN